MKELFTSMHENVWKLLTSIGWNDVLDILIIAVAIFYIIRLFKKTRAVHLLRGIIFLTLIYFIVTVFDFPTSSFVFGKLFSNIVIVIVLLFQPEIRHAIEEFGKGRLRFLLFKRQNSSEKERIAADISAIVNACINMSEKHVGALIVLEGRTPLGEIISTGSHVDAAVTSPVIENIFFPKAPLHDGAMIIRDGRIDSAGCILPLTGKSVGLELGTRHRAAIGLSESYDSLCVIVSEETGAISIARSGEVRRDLSSAELADELTAFLLPSDKSDEEELI